MRLPAGIWTLGLVSMFADISSEMIHSLLPVYMTAVLGASTTIVGVVEGIAESTATITKVFSGAISDRLGKRKLLAGLGYGVSAIAKPIFPLATSVGWVLVARFVDRIGKGIRGAPRDALVADIVPREMRGAAYGLRQSLDAVGALVGPLLAIVLMVGLANDIRAVLWVAVVPASIAVAVLILGVHDPARSAPADGRRSPTLADAKRLSTRFWLIVLLGTVVSLARFSEAFLVLRAQEVGFSLGWVPAVLVVMNIAYTATAYPAGVAADRVRPRTLLVVGLAVMIAADLVLAAAGSPTQVLLGAALWGVHMGCTQGLLAKLVVDAVPFELRASALGIFHVGAGGGLLVASVGAGALWSAFGAPAAFQAGAALAALAAVGLLAQGGKR
jgi:MFS family permease